VVNSLRAGAWPLLGRDREVRAVRDGLGHGTGSLLWVPAGVGRTTVPRAVLHEPMSWAMSRSAASAAGSCLGTHRWPRSPPVSRPPLAGASFRG